jgi:hypothetical protein
MDTLFLERMCMVLTMLLALISNDATSQELNIHYRTVIDDNRPLSYLTFTDEVSCKLLVSLC